MSDQHWSQMMLPRERIEQLENVNRELREENERVRQANLHTMDVFEDMKAAKEQAEARAVELLTVCQAVQRDLLLRAEPDWDGSGQQVVNLSAGFWEELNRVIGKYDDAACKSFDAMILRKQAEAVERAAMNFGGRDYAEVRTGLSEWAQSLRQQADEIEQDTNQ